LQKRLIDRCDILIKSSPFLLPDHKGFYSPQGVDADFFAPKFTFGFYGLIGPWLDFELLEKVALDNADAQIRLFGPINCQCPVLPENVFFHPALPYNDLPFILKAFDACLIPNKFQDKNMQSFLQGRHPIKAYEFLAAGKPVVATFNPALRQWQETIYLARNETEFLGFCQQVRKQNQAPLNTKRQKAMQTQTWTKRAKDLDYYFQEHAY
jgi:hypothetical protein